MMPNTLMISPTLYSKFVACESQALFSLEVSDRERNRLNPGAALGRIAHKIVEESSKNPRNWDEVKLKNWFEVKWNEYVEQQFLEMKRDWAPNRVLEPESWKGHFKVKMSTKTLVVKRSGLLPRDATGPDGEMNSEANLTMTRLPFVEKHLVDESLQIHGTPDYVFEAFGRLTIFDYKFGKELFVIEHHRTQMHFYVLLVESALGRNVDRCAIVASANRMIDLPIDRQYLRFLEHDIPRVVAALEERRVRANPSAEICQFCSYKLNCLDFMNSKVRTSRGYPLAVLGLVLGTKAIDDRFQEVCISSQLFGENVEYKVFNIPIEYEFVVGQQIGLSDNLFFHSDVLVEFQWNSRVLNLDQSL